MDKHCARCKTILDLMPSPYSKSIKVDGTIRGSYLCRRCNTDRNKKYRRTDAGSAAAYRSARNSILKDRQKERARRAVAYYIRVGKLTRPRVCESCPSLTRLDAHHINYSKPLDVTWLCRRCHTDIHKKM